MTYVIRPLIGTLICATLAVAPTVGLAAPAHNSGPGGAATSQPVWGTGAHPSPGPHDMGPADRAAVQKKLATQRAWLAAHPEAGASGGSASPYYPSGSWYFSNNYPTKGNPPPEPNSANVFGSSHGGGWHYQATKTSVSSSPSIGASDSGFYYYLCGPPVSTSTSPACSTTTSRWLHSTVCASTVIAQIL